SPKKKRKFSLMKANAKSRPLHWSLRFLLWINLVSALLLMGAYINTHVSPNSFSLLSFLGLAYPILLLINLIFVIFWIFLRWKYAALSLLTILIGWNHFRHFYAINFSQNDLNNPIKVLSFNVHVFDLYNL